MYTVARVFHPVGQGAFYSEKHATNGVPLYTVVYDCGTKKDQGWLSTRIANSSIICPDLMFLSHFHDDHYKGIKFLKPKVIILPILKEWDKIIFWISNLLGHSGFNPNLAADLQQKFGKNIRIIQIEPANDKSESSLNADTINIDTTDSNIFPSGVRLSSGNDPNWIYIPVNPCLDSSTVKHFEDLIKKEGLDLDKLKRLDSDYFFKAKIKLRNIYNAIGEPNEYSMAIYSGPSMHALSLKEHKVNLNNICCYSPVLNPKKVCPLFNCRLKPGCLYLGDMNLNNSLNPLKIIYKYLGSPLQEMIGTIQIPHHGSKENYNSNLLETYERHSDTWVARNGRVIYVISVGESNSYGHPSWIVMNQLMNSGHFLKLVTEDPASVLIEEFDFK